MRHFFIGLSISLGYSINPMVMAQGANADIQNLIRNFKIDKDHVSQLIKGLLTKGNISLEQAKEAHGRLDEIKNEDLLHLIMDSHEPKSVVEVASRDLITGPKSISEFELEVDEGPISPTQTKKRKYQ